MSKPETNNIIYGIHTCTAQLNHDKTNITKVYVKKSHKSKQVHNIIQNLNDLSIEVIETTKDYLTMICLSSKHQGIVFEIRNITETYDLDHYLQTISKPFIAIFDNIQDPRNLGSLIRTSNGAGVNLVIKKKSGSCDISPLVHKTASGGLQGIGLIETNNLTEIIKKIKNHNIMVVGTSDSASLSIYDMKPIVSGVAIIFGSEGAGISKSLSHLCDSVYSIPIHGSIECLNVAVAAGIVLYHTQQMIKNSK
tara:strand:+ start:491 stop:1243 length:753 start_codon:yes stop_codon:yes gene_type:complete